MINFITIKAGIVQSVQECVDYTQVLKGDSDTTMVDSSKLFKVGDTYSVEMWEEYNLTAEEKSKRASESRKQTGKPYELNGIVYQVPFTVEDATGMLQVKAAFDLGLHFTNFHFSNGVIMPLHSSEFLDFALWFANERNNFFIGD